MLSEFYPQTLDKIRVKVKVKFLFSKFTAKVKH